LRAILDCHRQIVLAGLTARRGRGAPAVNPERPAAKAPASFPIEAYKVALDKLVEMARAAGAREEQARIARIVRRPSADRFPRLALSLALLGVITSEQAYEAFAAAESDALARTEPRESRLPVSDGRVLH
jgi:hypothetical protein